MQPKYNINQKVIVSSSSKKYSAKIINIAIHYGKYHYMVHYKGWKSEHDEWITARRIFDDED